MAQRHLSAIQPASIDDVVHRSLTDRLPPPLGTDWIDETRRTLITEVITVMVAVAYRVRQRLMPTKCRVIASRNADHRMIIELS
jgi:hypothetical protein